MSSNKKYRYIPQAIILTVEKASSRSRLFKVSSTLAGSLALSILYFWLLTDVCGLEMPKTAILRKINANWESRIELMEARLVNDRKELELFAVRDNEVYRNIFGMNEIPREVRNAGFGGVDRYSHLDMLGDSSALKSIALRVDILTKMTYLQSQSFDEILNLSKKAGDMASCIPAIPPLITDNTKYRLSSPFGYRTDPITGVTKRHTGFDFSCKIGNPVYVTGDGVVETVEFDLFGYGNSVTVNHGFGYKTRYAHMKSIYVVEGMKLTRGERIGETGNSGRSTGPHLHYEVLYKGNFVNPSNYFDLTMPKEEYASLVTKAESESSNKLVGPHQRFKP